MESPKVSVIVPVYNDEGCLEGCLDSILGQSLQDLELICVDDGSSDGSAQLLADRAACDPRVKLLSHERNLGSSQARKDGVAVSTGRYLTFVDADDRLAPQACEIACREIELSHVDLLQFGVELIDCAGVPDSRLKANRRRLAPYPGTITAEGPTGLVDACWGQGLFSFNLWGKIYRGDLCREAFAEVEDLELSKAEDLYAFFVIAARAHSYRGISQVLYRYRYGAGGTGLASLSLEGFEKLLTEKQAVSALRRFAASHDPASLDPFVDGIERFLLDECVDRWLDSLGPENCAVGFDRLVEVWGYEEVFCALAEKCWSLSQHSVLEKLAHSDSLRFQPRPEGQRLTVAYYYRSIAQGGAQRVAAELCNLWAAELDEAGRPLYRVLLISDDGPQDEEYPLDPRVGRAYLPPYKDSKGASYRGRLRAWRRILADEAVDIVVSGMWWDAVSTWDMLAVKGSPSHPAFILHDHNFTMIPYRRADRLGLWLIRSYQLCDGVVVLSECDQSFVECFNNNVRYIPNPIAYLADNQAGREREPHSIVWAGRISGEKHPLDLIPMMQRVLEELPDAKLYLVGGGKEPLVQKMREEVERRGLQESIIFVGFTLDVGAWYQRASVGVCASEYEGFPMTIAEELSYSLPVVMYDLPWLSFVRDGRGICTVEPHRPDLMAKEVLALLRDPQKAQRVGREGRAQIDEIAACDLGSAWGRVFAGIDPDAAPRRAGSDERVLFEYLTVFQQQGKEKPADIQVAKLKERRPAPAADPRLSARIDIKNSGSGGNDLELLSVSDPQAKLLAPDWFCNEKGRGHVISSDAGSLQLRLRCVGDGVLHIILRGVSRTDDAGERIPVWVDYSSLELDGKPLLSGTRSAWHDEPLRFKRRVADGEEHTLDVTWHSHDQAALDREQKEREAGEAAREKAQAKEQKQAERIEEQKAELQKMRDSNSWKIGRAVTKLPRKIKSASKGEGAGADKGEGGNA